MNSTINTFKAGIRSDMSDHLTNPDSYLGLSNGRVMWSDYKGVGKSGSVMPLKGTKWAGALLCYGYREIGYCPLDSDSCVVVSTNGSYSEIGIATDDKETGVLSYRTLYNDRYDPNADRLKFAPERRIKVCVSIESPARKMVYILDPMQSPIYCVNLHFASEDGVFHHANNDCNVTPNSYPQYWSVHHFELQPDANMGELRFEQQTKATLGGLPSGVYRYAYRKISLHRDIVSTWSPLSMPVFVTAEKEVNNTHHDRIMGESGKGSRLYNTMTIVESDARWWGVEIGYTYSSGENTYEPFQIIGRYEPTIVQGVGENRLAYFSIIHKADGGLYSLPLEALSSLVAPIRTAADIEVHDNRLFIGGPILADDIKPQDRGVIIGPTTIQLESDNTLLPIFKDKSDKFTESQKKVNASIEISRYRGKKKSYPIINDFANYKGVQVNAELVGYGRDETVDVGILVYDKKGQPGQVTPIGTITFPSVYTLPTTKLNAQTGKYELNVAGMRISNIRFNKSDLLDENGELTVSGFSIVRTETRSNILHQGILFPTTRITPSRVTRKDPGIPNATFPLPWGINAFDDDIDRLPSVHRYWYESWFVKSGTEKGFADFVTIATDTIGAWNGSRPSTHNYYSPDTFIEEDFAFSKKTDSVQIVGTACAVYGKDFVPLPEIVNGAVELPSAHTYNKLYEVNGLSNPAVGRPKMGDEVRLRSAIQMVDSHATYEKYDPEDLNLYFEQHQHVQANIYGAGMYLDALHVKNGLLLTTEGWEITDVTNGPRKACFHIVNYLRVKPETPQDETDVSATNSKTYQYCGHYQPLNLGVLKDAIHTDDGETIVFDEVDVFGGDKYINFTDWTRLIPFFRDECAVRFANGYPYFGDYSVSHIAPIESKYNTDLKIGRRFARDGVRPQIEQCLLKNKWYENGIMNKQAESWSYNKSLLRTEAIRLFVERDPDSEYLSERPYTIYYSNQSIFGEIRDSKRIVLARNKRDLEGVYGAITNLATTMDTLYAIMKRALVYLPTKNRELLSTGSGAVYFGSGEVIEQERYINTENGCQRFVSVAKMGKALYWIDEKNKHFCRFSQDGLSKIDQDRAVRVEIGLDIDDADGYYIMPHMNQEEVIVSLSNSKIKAFIFHEYQNAITATLPTGISSGLMVGRKQLVREDTNQEAPLAIWGEGPYQELFGKRYPTILTFKVGVSPETEKVWNLLNMSLGADYSALDSVVGETEDNVGQLIRHDIPIPNPHVRHWGGRYRIPLVHPTERKPRLRGQILKLIFTFTVKGEEPFILHSAETEFNPGRYK